ncbi:PD-(D/E)XK nuclease family protein [Christensenellaceae bacterium OttesenSCG-928-M15]|nr:PD-(D/E)XK nuclease family protein [Christensenellaceae bacterium OttesenSCG-928-M15]
MPKRLRLAVRKLVEKVYLSGDLDNRYVDQSTMLDGARAHRMLQKQMGPEYRKEVSLSADLELDGIPLTVHGRADGVIDIPGGGLIVDEIKTSTMDLERVFNQHEVHLAQAKCYAYMLLQLMEQPPENITVQLTYYQLETGETARRQYPYTKEEIDVFFHSLLEQYAIWLRFERDWAVLRENTVKAAQFPFPAYRDGQRELAVASYSAIEKRKKLYAQAPTGIGKTISTLFPSVKAIGEGKVEKIFYLTAKTVTRAVAGEAVSLMMGKGLRLKCVILRAKEKLCPLEELNCNPDGCARAKGHYDRVNAAILDMLQNEDLMTPDVLMTYAQKHSVCPHEFSLDACELADLIVCDYNHVFDPRVYLRRFFAENGGNEYVFLIDEAHNLYERVRSMYTEAVDKADFLHVKTELKDKSSKMVKKAAGEVNAYLLQLRKEIDKQHVQKEADLVLNTHLEGFIKAAEIWLGEEKEHPLHKEVLELYFKVSAYRDIALGYGEEYTTIMESYGSDMRVTEFCLDPSGVIKKRLALSRASILFSATLTPLPYYREILGGTEDDGILALRSPFLQENLRLIAHKGISTKYADRERSVRPIADAIYEAVRHKRGNYLVFFPSFEYMETVYSAFLEAHDEIKTVAQDRSMDEGAREAFLKGFDVDNSETLAGFSVLGGIFSEGIDLKGDRLIGSLIVGVGLPKISLRQDLIRDYFQEKNGKGFDYAYVYPGMNKVLQAAGRVIRSEEDHGVVLLIDSRFATPRYLALYPPHWSHMRFVRSNEELGEFLRGL